MGSGEITQMHCSRLPCGIDCSAIFSLRYTFESYRLLQQQTFNKLDMESKLLVLGYWTNNIPVELAILLVPVQKDIAKTLEKKERTVTVHCHERQSKNLSLLLPPSSISKNSICSRVLASDFNPPSLRTQSPLEFLTMISMYAMHWRMKNERMISTEKTKR